MEKDFDLWNAKKKELDVNKRCLFFKEGEVWWCAIGVNIGEEMFGKGADFRRPVLIFKRINKNSCIVLPITSKEHLGSWYYPILVQGEARWIMLSQIRFISANRLTVCQYALPPEEYAGFKRSLRKFLGFF